MAVVLHVKAEAHFLAARGDAHSLAARGAGAARGDAQFPVRCTGLLIHLPDTHLPAALL